MNDAFDQRLHRPQMEIAREVLRTSDLLIEVEKPALHPVLKEEWKTVSDLNDGIVEAIKLKQPVFLAFFVARRLGEVIASEKARAIRSAHAQLKEVKAMRGKGGFAELANWVIPPPGHGMVWGLPLGPTPLPSHASGGSGAGGSSIGAGDFGSVTREGAYGGGGGHVISGLVSYGLTNGDARVRWHCRGRPDRALQHAQAYRGMLFRVCEQQIR